jgi:hypothetical protein
VIPLNRSRIGVRPQESASTRRGEPHGEEAHRHCHHRYSVEQRRGSAVVGANELGENPRREWDERDRQQQPEVEEEKQTVGPTDLGENRVVVDPDDADGREADRVGEILRPDIQELSPQRLPRWSGSPTSMMSRVAAIAKTPSANVSSRVVVIRRSVRVSRAGPRLIPLRGRPLRVVAVRDEDARSGADADRRRPARFGH